jgi:hypothetical protein
MVLEGRIMTTKSPRPLFICGAGISLSPPASLPSTGEIVELASQLFLPTRTNGDRLYLNKIRDIQPEVLFEQLSFLAGNHVRQLWDLLQVPGAKPNINHYLIVTLSLLYRVPVITLNFDTLLETAAAACNLKPKVYVPGRQDREDLLTGSETQQGHCVIWKIHGCLGTQNDFGEPSLHTTMSQLARPNRRLLAALAQLVSTCRLHIVGYSGRDGDFFPQLARILRGSKQCAQPVWIDPQFREPQQQTIRRFSATIHSRRAILGAEEAYQLVSVVQEQFPHSLGGALALFKAQPGAKNPALGSQRAEQRAAVERNIRATKPLLELEKEALLMCLLFQSGHTREAYNYGRARIERFQSSLPPALASAVTLYFSRVCDWNSKYDDFARFVSSADKIADKIVASADRPSKLLVQVAAECLRTRAESMLLGPVMKWPDKSLTFQLSIRQQLSLIAQCAATSFRIRRLLANFQRRSVARIWRIIHPKLTEQADHADSVQEVLAWQYYLDHQLVFMGYLARPLLALVGQLSGLGGWAKLVAPLKQITRVIGWLMLSRISRSVERAGAAYTQGDIYLYRTRFGLADDLEFANHFWTLVNHPVGHALALRDRAVQNMRAGKNLEASAQFLKCYRCSVACGSALTALKALIGLFHLQKPFKEAAWQRNFRNIQGNEHISFFRRASEHMKDHNSFK